MNKTYYLYRHIRKDKNEPFYIGIGTCYHPEANSWHTFYTRAFTTIKRSNFWNYVNNKTEHEVEIIMESKDRGFIEQKEIEFIKLYGRRDLGTGTLVNLTDGGEKGETRVKTKEQIEKHRKSVIGHKNYLYNNRMCINTRKKISEAHKNRGMPENWGEHCKGSKNPRARKTINTYTGITYGTFKEACEAKGIKVEYAQKRVKKDGEYKGLKYVDNNFHNKKKVLHINSGIEYESLAEGCRQQNESYNHQIVLIKKNKSNKKFKYLK